MHWSMNQQLWAMPWMTVGFIPTILWSTAWKALALWHAARRDEKWWFIAMLVINTVGILEICYLIFVVHLFSKVDNRPTSRKKR